MFAPRRPSQSLRHAHGRSFSRGRESSARHFSTFCAIALGNNGTVPCSHEELLPATPEAALMVLSLITDNLSRHVPAALTLATVQAAFAVHLLRWPSAVVDDPACTVTGGGFKEYGGGFARLARLIAEELRALREPASVIPAPFIYPLGTHPHRAPFRACMHCACALPAFGPMPLCPACFAGDALPLLAAVLSGCAADLQRWRVRVESRGSAPDGARFDFLNEFGRHALPASDSTWRSDEFLEGLTAHGSGRSSVDVAPRAGPIRPSLFGSPLTQILGDHLQHTHVHVHVVTTCSIHMRMCMCMRMWWAPLAHL